MVSLLQNLYKISQGGFERPSHEMVDIHCGLHIASWIFIADIHCGGYSLHSWLKINIHPLSILTFPQIYTHNTYQCYQSPKWRRNNRSVPRPVRFEQPSQDNNHSFHSTYTVLFENFSQLTIINVNFI